jgi:hypothetical protein
MKPGFSPLEKAPSSADLAGQKRAGIRPAKVENTGLVLWQFGSFYRLEQRAGSVSDRSLRALALRERAAFSASGDEKNAGEGRVERRLALIDHRSQP